MQIISSCFRFFTEVTVCCADNIATNLQLITGVQKNSFPHSCVMFSKNLIWLRMILRYLTLILLFLGCFQTIAQDKIELKIVGDNSLFFFKKSTFEFRDSTQCDEFLFRKRQKALQKGYHLFSYDSISRQAENWLVHVYIGPLFNTMQLISDEITLENIRNVGLREKFIGEIPFSSKEIHRLLSSIQGRYLNNGYPFVNVYLDSIQFSETYAISRLKIESGPFFTMNSIIVKGDSNLHVPLINNIIGIKSGAPYDESTILGVESRLNQQSYLKVIKAPELLFTPKGTDLYVYLDRIPVSSVNGIIGFQPNPTAEKLDVTGEINLKLANALNRGERINFQWQSIRDQTQNLETAVSYPYLFNSNFGIEGRFDLYKRDSTFLDFNFRSGVNYYLNNTSYLQAYYQGNRDNRLSGSANTQSFDRLGNSAVNMYGIGIHSSRLDYLPNPRKGYEVHTESGIGQRTSQETTNDPAIKSLSFRGLIAFDFYIPLYRKHVLKVSNTSEFIGSESGVFQNERFRFGGQQSQRGFNEDELNATTRITQTFEYRFLLDKNANVFLFYDQTWYEDNSSTYLKDKPFGFGTGFSFSTDLGLFSLSYALGKQFDNPIRIAEGKIHFGYIAYF